ncbi:AAA family ATPase [Pseudokineococcus sp. 5B2Z-1]|uniref:AAA family ATPase n=1 Tax=Pseudokineococcus sp. 5B2Z-1 TaxID=3132744 RepID=UPI0030A644D7
MSASVPTSDGSTAGARRPWVAVVTGAPGAGKSSTAAEVARLAGAALLDQDSMTNPLVDVVARLLDAVDYDDPRLAALVRAPRYAVLVRVAADCLAAGRPVVLVAPFTTERRDAEAWERFAAEVAAVGGEARLVWLRVEADVLAERLMARGAERDLVRLRDVAGYVAGLDLGAPVAPHLEVDAALAPGEQAARVVTALDAARPA